MPAKSSTWVSTARQSRTSDYAEFIENIPKPGRGPDVRGASPAGAMLLVGEFALRYLAHAKAYYARDGVPTGEHVTIRSLSVP